ncbi:sugar phosphate isomerase/epimerase [Breznakia sp. PF5-3]|uniref:sugar phosphate isomerase/epimerase family protein n=1 Tax=unclassified Breznakia TaxID=2623764 RepID=UPI002406833A|nr:MULTISPECIES: sugar phosphate isomerase/epimerase family protein [unclassified Breznakia]MDF9824842.1 sugar phosphate isomerase/epimerase [Breznakia sp. PM6-1]MDF9835196.1 sugar phosphate isomerase/epimerase [Breznakia sp. PF5-3]MDF9837308.1 sugar phosphate isomerase/epimerase [Breznakia sp. PFB2-8]MDF9859768.1 sugar phosphate isomerase/epimerase [Breznakia sp. PH5-24]
MKIGFVSSILADLTFEEVIDFAHEQAFEAVEIACWPVGKAERRYAGVTHIDVDTLDDTKIAYIQKYCKDRNVEISSLAYYPNNMDTDVEKRKYYNQHLLKVIDAASRLGVKNVTTFIGRMQDKNLEENLAELNTVWDPIIKAAEEKNILIGIENCPMYFTYDEWPAGQNLASSPYNWELIFDRLKSKNIGINYDPSHMILQSMDYLQPMLDFKDRLYHLHFKDLTLDQAKLDYYGYLVPPNMFTVPKIPGQGDIHWGKFITTALDAGFDGYACIEIEDRNFEGDLESRKQSLIISKRHLNNYI